MAQRFKIGDRVRLRRIVNPDMAQRAGNDRFNIAEEEFDRVHPIIEMGNNFLWGLLYHIKSTSPYTGNWAVLEEMVVPAKVLVNPVVYRVQRGPSCSVLEFEDGLTPNELIEEALGDHRLSSIQTTGPSMLTGDFKGESFSIMRVS